MADFIFNVAKGKLKYYMELPAANDAIMVAPLLASGIISDAAMKDLHDLAAVLATATDENTTMGRKTVAVTSTEDDAADKWVGSMSANPTWSSAGGGPIAALLFYYNPDTTAGSNDASCIPLAKYDFSITPNGGDITAQVNASGLFDAA